MASSIRRWFEAQPPPRGGTGRASPWQAAITTAPNVSDRSTPGAARKPLMRSLSDTLFGKVFAAFVWMSMAVFAIETTLVYRDTRNELAAELVRVNDLFGANLTNALWHLDEDRINLTLASILRVQAVGGLVLSDAKGRVLRELSRQPAPSAVMVGALPTGTEIHRTTLRQASARGVTELGTLDLQSNDAIIYERMKLPVLMTGAAAIIKAILMLAVFRLHFHRILSRPLLDIARHAASIDPRHGSSVRLPIRTGAPNELDVIAGALNRLVDDVTVAMQTQQRLFERLEQRMAQLKLAQAELVEAEKMAALGSLVAGVAHEINTPVGLGLTAASHLEHLVDDLARQLPAEHFNHPAMLRFADDARQLTRATCSSLERAAALVRSFTMVAVDQSVADYRWFNPQAYLQDVVLTHRSMLRHANVQLSIECTGELQVFSDPGAWAQVTSNLLNNAVVHAFGPGAADARMTITLAQDGDWVCVTFSDNGRGMPPETARRVFEPFFTTNRAHGGSGLGLHIVFNLVTQRLRGSISIDTAPGQGAAIALRLPMVLQTDGAGSSPANSEGDDPVDGDVLGNGNGNGNSL